MAGSQPVTMRSVLREGASVTRAQTAAPVQLICPCLIGRKDLMRMSYPAAVGDTTRTRVRQSLRRKMLEA